MEAGIILSMQLKLSRTLSVTSLDRKGNSLIKHLYCFLEFMYISGYLTLEKHDLEPSIFHLSKTEG